MTRAQAADSLREWLLANLPRPSLRPIQGSLEYLEHSPETLRWEPCWAVGCSLTFSLKKPPTLNWSSTERDLASAMASVALYREVVEFASLLEAFRSELMARVERAEKAKKNDEG